MAIFYYEAKRVRLREWRKAREWTQPKLAIELGCSLIAVARYETSTRLPEREIMKRIYVLTDRAVTPNDFYGVEDWEAELIRREGEAELARKAA